MPDRIQLKRVYDAVEASDGYRVLVDRLWPRGLSREAAQLDDWLKEIAPSTELRTWFRHEPSRWSTFKQRYFTELDAQHDALAPLRDHDGTVTLLFAAKDTERNNAVALLEYLSCS